MEWCVKVEPQVWSGGVKVEWVWSGGVKVEW